VTVLKALFQIKELNSPTCSVIIVQKKKSLRHQGRHPWLSFALTWPTSTQGIRDAEECQWHLTLTHRFSTTYSITSIHTIQWWCHRKAAMGTHVATAPTPSSMQQPCIKWCTICTILAVRQKNNQKRMSAHHLKRRAARSKTPIYEWQKWILLSRHSMANKK